MKWGRRGILATCKNCFLGGHRNCKLTYPFIYIFQTISTHTRSEMVNCDPQVSW
jgi:hypothetical protein